MRRGFVKCHVRTRNFSSWISRIWLTNSNGSHHSKGCQKLVKNFIRVSTVKFVARLVPSRFSYPRCGLWVGFDELAGDQGKDGLFLPPSQKALRALIAFPYSNAKKNKKVATGYESSSKHCKIMIGLLGLQFLWRPVQKSRLLPLGSCARAWHVCCTLRCWTSLLRDDIPLSELYLPRKHLTRKMIKISVQFQC